MHHAAREKGRTQHPDAALSRLSRRSGALGAYFFTSAQILRWTA
jgi:hypothetical protein